MPTRPMTAPGPFVEQGVKGKFVDDEMSQSSYSLCNLTIAKVSIVTLIGSSIDSFHQSAGSAELMFNIPLASSGKSSVLLTKQLASSCHNQPLSGYSSASMQFSLSIPTSPSSLLGSLYVLCTYPLTPCSLTGEFVLCQLFL